MKRIVVYRCQNCGGAQRILEMPWVREFVLSCAGQLEVIHILRAFEDGEYGVCVVHCDPEACKTLEGSARAMGRIAYTRRLLQEIPIDEERLGSVRFEAGCDLEKELLDFFESLKRKEDNE